MRAEQQQEAAGAEAEAELRPLLMLLRLIRL
jgi:hypothetical protein